MQNSNMIAQVTRIQTESAKCLVFLGGLVVLLIVLFMTVQVSGTISYILWRRGWMVLTMLIVAFATSASTLLFQTLTHNRILTPSLMGLEALFILFQTVLVFFNGAMQNEWLTRLVKFGIETGLLTIFAVVLYRSLLCHMRANLNLVLMVGIILGTLFRSAASLLQRILDPSEFAVLQGRLFATFTRASPELIVLSLGIILIIGIAIWRKRYVFDVLALGRDHAINLGLSYQREIVIAVFLISVLVAVSTALVGPLTFLGLMIVNITYYVSRRSQHSYLLPTAFLLATIALISGHLILEYGLGMAGSLSVVLEFIGGTFFIYLILKKV